MNRQLYMGGGIMNAVPREKALFGGIKKAVKKVTKGVKDIVSSDLGKAALVGAGLSLGGPTIMKGIKGLGSLAKAAKVPACLKGKSGLAALGIGAGALFGGAMAGKSEEEVEALTVSYTTGGMTVTAASIEASGVDHTAGVSGDKERWKLSASFAF